MTKKKKLSISIITLILLGTTVMLVKRGEKSTQTPKSEDVSFQEQNGYVELEDGWIAYTVLSRDKDTDGHVQDTYTDYFFDVDSLIYCSLEDHYIPVVDSESKKEVERATVNIPSYFNGVDTRDEIEAINNFLNEKKFKEKITEKDLESLQLSHIKKSLIVDTFNQALEGSVHAIGKYRYGGSYQDSKKSSKGYSWQVSLIPDFGRLHKVQIEVIYDDGTHLEQKIKEKTASEQEQKLYKTLSSLEDKIVEEQCFNITLGEELTSLGFDTDTLKILLEHMEEDGVEQ